MSNALMYYCACSVPETVNKKSLPWNCGGWKYCTRHLKENIELNKKQGRLYLVLLFRRKIVFVFCFLILEKPWYLNSFHSFRTGCMRFYRFATEEQLSLFMDSLWSLITLILSFMGKKYLGYFLYPCYFNWASSHLRFSGFVFQLLSKSAT